MLETKWQIPMPWHKDNVIVKPNVRHWSKEDNKRFAEQYVWMPISELAKLYPGQSMDALKARAWRMGIKGKSLVKSK